jgi:hypothetical protein
MPATEVEFVTGNYQCLLREGQQGKADEKRGLNEHPGKASSVVSFSTASKLPCR